MCAENHISGVVAEGLKASPTAEEETASLIVRCNALQEG